MSSEYLTTQLSTAKAIRFSVTDLLRAGIDKQRSVSTSLSTPRRQHQVRIWSIGIIISSPKKWGKWNRLGVMYRLFIEGAESEHSVSSILIPAKVESDANDDHQNEDEGGDKSSGRDSRSGRPRRRRRVRRLRNWSAGTGLVSFFQVIRLGRRRLDEFNFLNYRRRLFGSARVDRRRLFFLRRIAAKKTKNCQSNYFWFVILRSLLYWPRVIQSRTRPRSTRSTGKKYTNCGSFAPNGKKRPNEF